MKSFRYVGPPEIRERWRGSPGGVPVTSRQALLSWMEESGEELWPEGGWATYVIDLKGTLLVAPRRSEHVACASGADVLAAGEIRFDEDAAVVEVTNLSTGYCPAEDCWEAVRSALDDAGLDRPEGLTFVALFRRCPRCRQRNLVKDDWFHCGVCDAELPRVWNFDAE